MFEHYRKFIIHITQRSRARLLMEGRTRLTTSDSVTRINDSTRLESRFLVTWTRVTLRKMVTQLESCFHRMTRLDSSHNQWLETRVRVIFTKSLSSWWTNPRRLHTKKWAIFASVMITIGGNFLFCLFSRSMLHFQDQVSPTCIEGDLRLCFHWGVSRIQYIDKHLIVV